MRRNLQVLAKAILFLLWLGGAYFIWLSRNTVTSDERLEQKNSVSAERSDNEQSVTSVGSVDLVAVGETGPRPSGANGNFSKQAGSASVDNRNKSLGRRKSVTDVSSEFLPENQEMIALLVENVRWAKKVREECGRFSAAVESGKLDVDNNNGMWQASSATSHVVMSATFYSKDGLMSTFTKRVY